MPCTRNYFLLSTLFLEEAQIFHCVQQDAKDLPVCGCMYYLLCSGLQEKQHQHQGCQQNQKICKAGTVVDNKLETFESVRDKRSLSKQLSIMDNT